MAKIKRGRLTISANIVLTASVITRTLSLGLIVMAIYIKVGDDILDTDVIKVADMQDVAGMPLGTTVKSIILSLNGVFGLELLTGIFGIWGVIGQRKPMLMITVLMSSVMIIIYSLYLVILSILYNEKSCFRDTLFTYTRAYEHGLSYISYLYFYDTFPHFLSKAISIVAVEYTYRKLEFKEKKASLTDNKYYLLLTIQHGIFRNVLIFAKDNWKRSKSVFISVILKTSSLIVGACLLGLGLTLLGDNFIHDSSLKYIFYKIQFNNYYFYDILVGLTASCVVNGILSMIISTIGLVGSWRKSIPFLLMSSVLSTILHMPRIIAIVMFVVFIKKFDDNMTDQLGLQQQGYYYTHSHNEITKRWNGMILTLDCCGVHNSSDTTSGVNPYSYMFCCQNAHESRMDSYNRYTHSSSNLQYFGGCGGYKTEIVGLIFSNKEYSEMKSSDLLENRSLDDSAKASLSMTIIFRTVFGGTKSFFISNWKRSKISILHVILLVILASVGLWSIMTASSIVQIGFWGKFIACADTELEYQLSTDFTNNMYTYMYSRESGYYGRETSLYWNTLFVKAECCGVGINITNSFTASYWYRYRRDWTSQRIPVQCCKSQTEVYPYASLYDTDCTNNLLNGYYHSQGCDTVIVNRLDFYSLIFFVFMGINVLAEIGMIATTIYNAVSLTKEENAIRCRYRSDEDNVELIEITGNTTPKSVQR